MSLVVKQTKFQTKQVRLTQSFSANLLESTSQEEIIDLLSATEV